MSKTARRAAAARMVGEILVYLGEVTPPGVGALDETWEQMELPGRAMLDAVEAFVEGRITYAELEEAGTRYVEAWGAVGKAFSAATPPRP